MYVDIYVYVSVWSMTGNKRKTEVTLVNFDKKVYWQMGSLYPILSKITKAYISRTAPMIFWKHCSMIGHNR